MDSVLARIKELVRAWQFRFSRKADEERLRDGFTESEVVESILNADGIEKTLRSTSPSRPVRREKLYVIHGPTDAGTWIYTKGTIRRVGGEEEYYLLVSSKRLE